MGEKTWCFGLKKNRTSSNTIRPIKGCFLSQDCDALVMVSSHPWLDQNQGITEKDEKDEKNENDDPFIFWYLFMNTNLLQKKDSVENFYFYLNLSPYNDKAGVFPLKTPFLHFSTEKGSFKLCHRYMRNKNWLENQIPAPEGVGYVLNGMESIVDSDSVQKYVVSKFMSKKESFLKKKQIIILI
jgi:hypothetical protein